MRIEAKAVPALSKGMKDSLGIVRYKTTNLIAEIGPNSKSEALPLLVQAWLDIDKRVRFEANRGLVSIGKEAVPAFGESRSRCSS